MSSVCSREEIGAWDAMGEGSVCAATVVGGNGGTGGLESKHDPAVCDWWVKFTYMCMWVWLLIEGRNSLGGVLLTERAGGTSLLGSNEDNFARNSEMPSYTASRKCTCTCTSYGTTYILRSYNDRLYLQSLCVLSGVPFQLLKFTLEGGILILKFNNILWRINVHIYTQ